MNKQPAANNPFKAACRVGNVTAVIGVEGSNIITVALQLKDNNGNDIAERCSIDAYLSTDAAGDTIAPTAPSGGIAAGTDGIVRNLESGKVLKLVSEADGDIDVAITESGVATWYLQCILPDAGKVAIGPITFA